MKRKYGGTTSRSVRRRLGRRSLRRYRRKFLRRGGGLRKAIRNVVLSTSETKYTSSVETSASIYHNGGMSNELAGFKIWDQNPSPGAGLGINWPTLGDGNGQRNGNEIFPVGIKIRMELQCPLDRRSVKLRLFLVKYNSEQGNPRLKSNFFENSSYEDLPIPRTWSLPSQNVMLDPLAASFSKKKILDVVLSPGADSQYIAEDADANRNNITKFYTFWIPLKRKMVWDRDVTGGSPKMGLSKEACVIVPLAYHNYSTDETDSVITVARFVTQFYYKDP